MDAKRMLTDRLFWLSALLAAAAVIFSTPFPDWEKTPVLEAGAFLGLAGEGLKGRTVLYGLPFISALPYGSAYLQERRQGFLRQLLIRRSRRDYRRDKLMITPLSGILVWVLAAAAVVLLYFLLFFPRERPGAVGKEEAAGFLEALLRLGLLAGSLANLCACCALLFCSYSMAFGLPLLLFYLPLMLYERYFQEVYVLDPMSWLAEKGDWGPEGLGLWLFLALVFLGTCALHGLLLRIRIEEVE